MLQMLLTFDCLQIGLQLDEIYLMHVEEVERVPRLQMLMFAEHSVARKHKPHEDRSRCLCIVRFCSRVPVINEHACSMLWQDFEIL